MKVLFDTNTVLDVLLGRQDFEAPAAALMTKAETNEIGGFLASTSLTTIYYIAAKSTNRKVADRAAKDLLNVFDVAPIDKKVLLGAVGLGFADFEDAVIHAAASQASLDAIVTRNPKDFKKATLPVYTPHQLLGALDLTE